MRMGGGGGGWDEDGDGDGDTNGVMGTWMGMTGVPVDGRTALGQTGTTLALRGTTSAGRARATPERLVAVSCPRGQAFPTAVGWGSKGKGAGTGVRWSGRPRDASVKAPFLPRSAPSSSLSHRRPSAWDARDFPLMQFGTGTSSSGPGDCLVRGGGGGFWPSWDSGQPTHPPDRKLFPRGKNESCKRSRKMEAASHPPTHPPGGWQPGLLRLTHPPTSGNFSPGNEVIHQRGPKLQVD